MPSVDLLDAFAELVVRVVFSLPHTEPEATTSSDDDMPHNADSSATHIFSRSPAAALNDAEEDEDGLQLPFRPRHETPLTQLSVNHMSNSAVLATSCSNSMSRGSSAASLDLYPGGIWNAIARVPAVAAAAAASSSNVGGRPPRPASTLSLGTGDNVSTPRSAGPGFWSRVMGSGGSGRTQTPPHSPSFGPNFNTGLSTTASSFVQLTEEEMCMGAAAAAAAAVAAASCTSSGAAHSHPGNSTVGGAASLGASHSMWAGLTTPPFFNQQYGAPYDWTGEESLGAAATATAPYGGGFGGARVAALSEMTTPVRDAYPAPASSSSSSNSQGPHQHQHQHQRPASARLVGPHGLYTSPPPNANSTNTTTTATIANLSGAGHGSGNGGGSPSQYSSTSDFVIL